MVWIGSIFAVTAHFLNVDQLCIANHYASRSRLIFPNCQHWAIWGLCFIWFPYLANAIDICHCSWFECNLSFPLHHLHLHYAIDMPAGAGVPMMVWRAFSFYCADDPNLQLLLTSCPLQDAVWGGYIDSLLYVHTISLCTFMSVSFCFEFCELDDLTTSSACVDISMLDIVKKVHIQMSGAICIYGCDEICKQNLGSEGSFVIRFCKAPLHAQQVCGQSQSFSG